MKIKKLSVAVSTALVVAYLPVQADDGGLGGGPEVKLRGFGTFGVVRNTNSNLDFMDNLSQSRGAGYSHKWDFGVDSKLAVQADGKFNDKLSASWQVMSQRQTDDTYRPMTEMAFMKYQATGDVNIRVGRLPAPLFMVSEYRKVGYVNPWVRQPNEVYFQVPFNSMDGGDVSYQLSSGDFTGNFQLAAGTMRKATVQSEGDISTLRGDNGLSLNFVGEYGPFTFRIGHSRTKITYTGESISRLYNGLQQIAAYGNDANYGAPKMVYNTVYSSVYNTGIYGPLNPASFQTTAEKAKYQQLLALQAGLNQAYAASPNMTQESVVSYIRNGSHTDPNLIVLQQGILGVEQSATQSANTARTTYNGASLSGSTLQSNASQMYDEYAADQKPASFTGIGVIFDPGTWLIQGEYTQRKTDSFVADSTGWYLTTGYRFGKFMPFVSFSQLKVDSPLDAQKLITGNDQKALAMAGASCSATVQAGGTVSAGNANSVCYAGYGLVNSLSEGVDKTVKATSYGQKNVSFGLRWDAFKSAAIKFQYDRIDMDGLPRGTPNNYLHALTSSTGAQTGGTALLGTADNYKDPTDPTAILTGGAAPGKTAVTEFDKTKPLNVFSLAVDFVF